MSMIERKVFELDSVLIQHDWNQIVACEKFFIGRKKYGQKSEFTDVRQNADGTYSLADFPYRKDVKIKRISPSNLSIQLSPEEPQILFIAPASEYKEIHATAINSVDISPIGNLGLSSAGNGELTLWNVSSGKISHTLNGHFLDVNKCRFSPDGQTIVSAGLDMTLRVWSVESGECKHLLKGHTQSVFELVILGSTKELLSCSRDGTVRKWSYETGECMHVWECSAVAVNSVAVDDKKDPKIFVCCTQNGQIFGYSLETGDKCLEFTLNPPIPCNAIHISASPENGGNKVCYAGTDRGEIHCINLSTGAEISILRVDCGRVLHIDTVPQGLFVSFGDGSLKLISNPKTNPLVVAELVGPDIDPVYDFAISNGIVISICRDKIIREYNFFIH